MPDLDILNVLDLNGDEVQALSSSQPIVECKSPSASSSPYMTFSFQSSDEAVDFTTTVLSTIEGGMFGVTKGSYSLNYSFDEDRGGAFNSTLYISSSEDANVRAFTDKVSEIELACKSKVKKMSEESRETQEAEDSSDKLPEDNIVTLKDASSKRYQVNAPLGMLLPLGDAVGQQVLKLPIAKIGRWEHPEYGEIKFTQGDLNAIKLGIESRVTGYDIPLFLGHPGNDGTPSEGYLTKAEQEGEVLFGYWQVVNPRVYQDVKDQRIRYSSSEFVTNYSDKTTGTTYGITLIGMALTPRPFIPNLPTNVALADANSTIFCLTNTYIDKEKMEVNENTPTPTAAPISSLEDDSYQMLLSEVASANARANDAIQKATFLEDAYKLECQRLSDEKAALEARIKVFEDRYAEETLTKKIEEVRKLFLSEATKERLIGTIKAGNLTPEGERALIDGARELSESFTKQMTGQYGVSPMVESPATTSQPNPFESIINRNQQAAAKR